MDKRLYVCALAFLLVLSFSSLIVRPAVAQIYTDLTVTQAKEKIGTDPFLVILDVRNQSEYDTRHIRNAMLIPVWNLTQNLDELNRNDEILVYCAAGSRSANASSILISNGFLYVYNMLEGISGWVTAGYPVYIKYPSIQAAVENATAGQTLYVSSGLYNESLTVDRPITLVGENARTTTLNASTTVMNVTADNVAISDFTIQYTGCACFGYSSVNVTNSQNVNVTDNVIISDDFGIRVVGARRVVVADNNVTHGGEAAIVVVDSQEVSVFENGVTAARGMEILNSDDSAFWNNTILCDFSGILIIESYNDAVFGNNFSSNALVGLSISNCINDSFFGNNVFSNGQYEVYMSQSYNNSIFDNCFLAKNNAIIAPAGDNSSNFWDNGLEGNYWSSYTGADTDNDGIGDTPYPIDTTNRDNHPLMGLFHSYTASLNHTVNVVSNSTMNSFEYIESNRTIVLQVSNATADQTFGFCRISIPHSLIDPYNGSISVVIDDGQTRVLFLNDTLYDNGTYRWIYFTYQQSTHSISVIALVAEFPSFLLLAAFMIGTIIVAATYRRRRISLTRCRLFS
jgi:rhodanese-related sulfurtransferase